MNNINNKFLVQVGDYHHFADIQANIKLSGLIYEFEEVGSQGSYYAVFWLASAPKPVDYIDYWKGQFDR